MCIDRTEVAYCILTGTGHGATSNSSSVLENMRMEFSQVISSAFSNSHVNTEGVADLPALRVIQDVNIEIFFNLIAEIFAERPIDFFYQAILVPIDTGNGVAVYFLPNVSDPLANGIEITRRIVSMNRREFPTQLRIASCAEATAVLIRGFEVIPYQSSDSLACQYCIPGIEYRTAKTCAQCNTSEELNCSSSDAFIPCTANRNAVCSLPISLMKASLCNNKFLDFGEQCDASAILSATAACCADQTCLLKDGFYAEPPCSTICGDGIKAGAEECDSLFNDPACDTLSCKLR